MYGTNNMTFRDFDKLLFFMEFCYFDNFVMKNSTIFNMMIIFEMMTMSFLQP